MAFGRVVKLSAGRYFAGNETSGGSSLDLSALDIRFDVTRSIEWYDNGATIELWNAKPETIRWLMSDGNAVRLQAGYEDETVGNIFVGQIADVRTERDGAGFRTTLSCVSARGCFYQLSRLHVAVDFPKGTTFRECLDAFCAYAGIALRTGWSKELSEGIPWDFRESGTFNAVVSHFAEYVTWPYWKKKIFLDNNELIVMDFANAVQIEKLTLDYSHGLLSATEIRDESLNKANFGDDPSYYFLSEKEGESSAEWHAKEGTEAPEDTQAAKITRPRKAEFSALMTPKLGPNVFVDLDSSAGSEWDSVTAVKGTFVVTRAEFKGGNCGTDFTVRCEAVETDQLAK